MRYTTGTTTRVRKVELARPTDHVIASGVWNLRAFADAERSGNKAEQPS